MLKCAFMKVFVVCFHFQKYMSVPFLPIHAILCTFFTGTFFTCTFFPVPLLPYFFYLYFFYLSLFYRLPICLC